MQNRPLKWNVWLLIFAIFYFAPSIVWAEVQKPGRLKIELGQGFLNDQVKVYLDKKLVYNKHLTTPDSATITDFFNVTKPKKPFTLTVEVNGTKFEKSSPKQRTELDRKDYSLLINYDRETEEVELKTKILIILYD